MIFIVGWIMLVIAVVLIFLGRARNGEQLAVFQKSWVIEQGYVMTAQLLGMIGLAFVILNWPR
jgi:hypothetical protein